MARRAKAIQKISNRVITGLSLLKKQVFKEVPKQELPKTKTGSQQIRRNRCFSSNRTINKRRVASAADLYI